MSIFIQLFVFSFSCFSFFNPKNLVIKSVNNLPDQSTANKQNSSNANIDPNNKNFNDQNSNTNADAQNDPQNENAKITNTSTCVSVGEIWNDTTKSFKKTELFQLIKYASNSTISFSDISALKNRTVTAGTMRGYNGSKDILVTLGGLQWTVTYLSTDKSGNPILTLWLSDSAQLSGKSVYSNGGTATATPTKKTFDTYGRSTWNSGFSANVNSYNNSYPDGMYGTSYIRAVTLNNGGYYTTASGTLSSWQETKHSDSVFSPFTITTNNKTNIADYLVTPYNVSWQENQRYSTYNTNHADLPNDSWKENQTEKWYSGMNYTIKPKYNTWKDDLIWLPSLVETAPFTKLWDISVNQRSNSNCHYYIRTAEENRSAGNVYHNNKDGSGYFGGGIAVNNLFGVRPAVHLNLTTAVASAKDIWAGTNFEPSNLNLTLQYLYGTNTATTNASLLSSLSSAIGSGTIKSSTIKTNANKVTDKAFINANSELVIKFGGLYWYAVYLTKNTSGQIILTMWLTDSSQLYGKNKVSGIAYNKYGSGTFNSGSPPYSNGSTTISNNYGNNYVRTTLLSSGNTTSVFYPYTKTTTNKTAMGDFIVAPKDLNTQDTLNLQKTQSAKSTLGFRYNLLNESYASIIKFNTAYKTLTTSTTNYTSWQNDKLWLPSLSEVGLGSNNATINPTRASGLWGLSTAQRSNTNKTVTWLRSGHVTDKNLAYTISSDGLDYGYETIDTQNAIRPALHLNLTLACQYAS